MACPDSKSMIIDREFELRIDAREGHCPPNPHVRTTLVTSIAYFESLHGEVKFKYESLS